MSQLLAVIASFLAIVIGLWKYFTSKAAETKKKKDEAVNELREALNEKDPSRITAALDRLNWGDRPNLRA